jgi:hypothetical protein
MMLIFLSMPVSFCFRNSAEAIHDYCSFRYTRLPRPGPRAVRDDAPVSRWQWPPELAADRADADRGRRAPAACPATIR